MAITMGLLGLGSDYGDEVWNNKQSEEVGGFHRFGRPRFSEDEVFGGHMTVVSFATVIL